MSPPMTVTEDTPADMLSGCMDLDIILPNGHQVRTSIQRRTPMMDLLVQVTTAHRLVPSNHSLQPTGERGALPFKPSTPIGALDAFAIKIVPKKANLKKAPQIPNLVNTFRLQVHLPRSQLFVSRVSPDVTVGDVLAHVCKEKNLDQNKYELRSTGNLNEPLNSKDTLGFCKTQELTLIVKGVNPVRHLSSADIIHVKQSNNKQNSVCDSSLSSESLGSRSVSPITMSAPPQPPLRKKRRPAPKPPVQDTQTRTISHSRESSDSSGYHEPSHLSESPTHGGPPSMGRNSQSLSNLTSLPQGRLAPSASVSSLSSNGTAPTRKKRAPPPPSQQNTPDKVKSCTLPAESRRISEPALASPPVELAPFPPVSPGRLSLTAQINDALSTLDLELGSSSDEEDMGNGEHFVRNLSPSRNSKLSVKDDDLSDGGHFVGSFTPNKHSKLSSKCDDNRDIEPRFVKNRSPNRNSKLSVNDNDAKFRKLISVETFDVSDDEKLTPLGNIPQIVKSPRRKKLKKQTSTSVDKHHKLISVQTLDCSDEENWEPDSYGDTDEMSNKKLITLPSFDIPDINQAKIVACKAKTTKKSGEGLSETSNISLSRESSFSNNPPPLLTPLHLKTITGFGEKTPKLIFKSPIREVTIPKPPKPPILPKPSPEELKLSLHRQLMEEIKNPKLRKVKSPYKLDSPKSSEWKFEFNNKEQKMETPEKMVEAPIKPLNILEPPPKEVIVDRRESSANWNKFLTDLNKILDGREDVGSLAKPEDPPDEVTPFPAPSPRLITLEASSPEVPVPLPRSSVKPQISSKPRHLVNSRSCQTFELNTRPAAFKKNLSSGDVMDSQLGKDFEFQMKTIKKWDIVESLPESSSMNNNVIKLERQSCEKHEILHEEDDDFFQDLPLPPVSTQHVLHENELAVIKTEPASTSDEHDSLNVDWQYQLPPPPSHFRDVPSPTVTEFGTVTIASDIFAQKRIEPVDNRLNGIYEDPENEIKKSEDEILKNYETIEERCVLNAHKENPRTHLEERKVLTNKNEVMAELTNVLNKNRIQEKSSSYGNLFMANGDICLRKNYTLGHSQSFANPPLSNFKISNYESTPRLYTRDDLDDNFRKPIAPSSKVRRADSVNVGKRNTWNSGLGEKQLKQEFLQFLQEKKLVDLEVGVDDLGDLSKILPPVVPAKESKINELTEENEEIFEQEVQKSDLINKPDEIAIDTVSRARENAEEPIRVVKNSSSVETTKPVEIKYEIEEAVRKVETRSESLRLESAKQTEPLKDDKILQKTEEPRRESIKAETVKELVQPIRKEEKVIPIRKPWQPPTISMGTWGERPKTTVLIRDTDYITQENIGEKRPHVIEEVTPEEKKVPPKILEVSKKVVETKHVISIKKPSNYELFSALPRRKEPTPVSLYIGEVEREPAKPVENDSSRLPVVCAVELKKEYRSEPDLIKDLGSEIKIENKIAEVPRTSSVYINGFTKPYADVSNTTKVNIGTFTRSSLMPVVKGFREIVKVEGNEKNQPKKTETIIRQESMPILVVEPTTNIAPIRRQESLPAKKFQSIQNQGIPPPPPFGLVSLKSVNNRPMRPKPTEDPRDQLLEQIRSFGGRDSLRKTAQ